MISRFQRMGMSGQRLGSAPSPPIDLNSLGWTDAQKVSASIRAQGVRAQSPFLHPDLTFYLPPADSLAFFVNPATFTPYPALAAPPVTILSYTAPQGKLAVINKIAIVNVGGNPPDGTGDVIWSVTINGGGQKGLGQISFQVGTLAAPNDIEILLIENDVCQVNVQVVAGAPPPGTTTAIFHGWTYPLSEAILPASGRWAK